MKRTLVLAVDRDDDFGNKADIQTPAIGIFAVKDAAMKLGSVDPEDSDVNSLFAAIRIYNDLVTEGKDARIALICGDKKVGHVSDTVIVEELEEVLREVRPDSVVLVSDGSEDEFVYPIISSRVPIDSIRKVYVKQSLGLEGSLYILYKFLKDSDKKRRFLAPLGWILVLIASIFIASNLLMYLNTGDAEYLFTMTGRLAVFALGMIFIMYAYDTWYKLKEVYDNTMSDFKSGSLRIIFVAVAFAMVICGFIIAVLATQNTYDESWFHNGMVFISNFIWFLIFAVIIANFGTIIEEYIRVKVISRPFIIGTITVLALGFIVQGILDIMNSVLGYAYAGEQVILYELMIGVGFGFCATLIHATFKEFETDPTEENDTDAVQ